jgi:hypothetical protein
MHICAQGENNNNITVKLLGLTVNNVRDLYTSDTRMESGFTEGINRIYTVILIDIVFR